jgi:hypothetical protein
MGPRTPAGSEPEEAVSDHEPRGRDEDGENVFALVAQLARRASDGQLVVAAAIGIIAAVLVGLVRPDLWFLGLPFLCVGSFGTWGIAERTETERAARLGPNFGGRRALAGVRASAAIVGTLSATLTLLAGVARMIGTWKS